MGNNYKALSIFQNYCLLLHVANPININSDNTKFTYYHIYIYIYKYRDNMTM
jgi:hypothetical protein